MMKTYRAAAVAACLSLTAACGQIQAPSVLPEFPVPTEVQLACKVLQWVVPAAQGFLDSPDVRRYVDMAQPAIAACAAGNATTAVISIAKSLQGLLLRRGVRPPAGAPLLR